MPARALCAFITTFMVCTLIPAVGVFAEEGETSAELATLEAETPITETPAVDPLRASEQALRLGEGAAAAPVTPSSAASIFRILLTLALVAAAIYGLVYFLKKAAKGKTVQDPFLKILASAPLGINKNAFVIALGSQAWLVGAAENGVNLIGKIEDKEILDAMLLEDSKRTEAGTESPAGRFPDFKSFLRKLGVQFEAGAPGPDNIRKRRERLKGL